MFSIQTPKPYIPQIVEPLNPMCPLNSITPKPKTLYIPLIVCIMINLQAKQKSQEEARRKVEQEPEP